MTRRGGGLACVPTFPSSLSRRRSVLPLTGPGMHGPLGLPPLLTARKEADLADQATRPAGSRLVLPTQRQTDPRSPPPPIPTGWESQHCPLLPPSISGKPRRDVTTVTAKCSVSLENYQTQIQNNIPFGSISDFYAPPMIKPNGTQACVGDSAKADFWKHIHRPVSAL